MQPEPDLAALFSGGGSSPSGTPSLPPGAKLAAMPTRPQGGRRRSLFVADDDPGILKVAEVLLGRFYEVTAFSSGEAALAAIEAGARPDVLLSDQRMGALSGTDLIAKVSELLPSTVCAIMTGYGEIREIITGISKGQIHLYISKPWQPGELVQMIRLCFQHRDLLQENRVASGEAEEQGDVLTEIRGDLTGVNRDFFLLHQKARATLIATARVLGTLLSGNGGHYHDNHADAVARISVAVADAIGYRGEARTEIELAALLHDIGKAELREEIRVADPETLRGAALSEYESHVARGVAMLQRINRFGRVWEIVSQHHEQGDGTGFPNRLPLRLILREAQIISLADAYHNLTSRLSPAEWAKRKAGIDLPRSLMDIAERQQQAAPWFATHAHLYDPIVYRAFLDVAASGKVPGFKMIVE
ncbi:HDIG domain-containing protein [Verrucomicrobium sp. GAS474]|uniref:HD domain-containing phosphohydrolase n=1 Tax=Verrucomicrobium sp. GAS474 TaxID=1882831 RepID=UPI0008794669|nr:HD domain-containing phosphohydrolase [Verrucomicrobium sp. GAS474]SDT91367.1 HDIG domain-containing protein [Verrucomicrobium sp. GAS474]